MYKFTIFFALLTIGLAAEVRILSQDMDVNPDGHFQWSYETDDGTKAVQEGEPRVVDKDNVAEVMRGSFAYSGDDGQKYQVTYTADEFGFHPEGAHLPVAPPVPEPIARALAWIAAHPSKEDSKRF